MANPLSFLADKLGGGLLDGVKGIIEQFVDDPQEVAEAERMILEEERRIQQAILEFEAERIKQGGETARAEIASEHWLAANWRPLLMLTFTFIVAWNYVVVPLTQMPETRIPSNMWQLMKIGVGGYVVGRSAEKIIPNSRWGKSEE